VIGVFAKIECFTIVLLGVTVLKFGSVGGQRFLVPFSKGWVRCRFTFRTFGGCGVVRRSRSTFGGFGFGGNHGDNIIANGVGAALEFGVFIDDRLVLEGGAVHEGLAMIEGAGFKCFGLNLDPTGPVLGLLDAFVGSKDMLNLFAFRDGAGSSRGKDEEAFEGGINCWDVVLVSGGVKTLNIRHCLDGHVE